MRSVLVIAALVVTSGRASADEIGYTDLSIEAGFGGGVTRVGKDSLGGPGLFAGLGWHLSGRWALIGQSSVQRIYGSHGVAGDTVSQKGFLTRAGAGVRFLIDGAWVDPELRVDIALEAVASRQFLGTNVHGSLQRNDATFALLVRGTGMSPRHVPDPEKLWGLGMRLRFGLVGDAEPQVGKRDPGVGGGPDYLFLVEVNGSWGF